MPGQQQGHLPPVSPQIRRFRVKWVEFTATSLNLRQLGRLSRLSPAFSAQFSAICPSPRVKSALPVPNSIVSVTLSVFL
jgi:hypothetical protein